MIMDNGIVKFRLNHTLFENDELFDVKEVKTNETLQQLSSKLDIGLMDYDPYQFDKDICWV